MKKKSAEQDKEAEELLKESMLMEAIGRYHCHYEANKIWEKTTWLGQPMWKLPSDAIVLQEIIFETRPDLIIETGTGMGGSALFYASIQHLLDNGSVLTIDKERRFHSFGGATAASRISFIQGSSTDQRVLDLVRKEAGGRRCMVILDSWHSYEHVKEELAAYWRYVDRGCYLVVEDTHVSGHPVPWEWGKGPYEAAEEFAREYSRHFEVDRSRERHLMTFNPHGYLKRRMD